MPYPQGPEDVANGMGKDRLIEDGAINGGAPNGHSYELMERPDGTRYINYESHEDAGTADSKDDIESEWAASSLGEYFVDSHMHPEFAKWWQQPQRIDGIDVDYIHIPSGMKAAYRKRYDGQWWVLYNSKWVESNDQDDGNYRPI